MLGGFKILVSSSYARANSLNCYEVQFNKASDRVGHQRWARPADPTEGAGISRKFAIPVPREEELLSYRAFARVLTLGSALLWGGTESYRPHIWGRPHPGSPGSLPLALDPFSGQAPGILCPF